MFLFLKLTSAVPPRAAVYVNISQIISFAEQTGGGTAIKLVGGVVLAVSERAEFVAGKIEEATRAG